MITHDLRSKRDVKYCQLQNKFCFIQHILPNSTLFSHNVLQFCKLKENHVVNVTQLNITDDRVLR